MENVLPYQISPHFSRVLSRLGAAAPTQPGVSDIFAAMNRQCTPAPAENNILPCELDDPLGAACHQVTPRLVRQYKNRALLLSTNICFSYCRFCFRRAVAGNSQSPVAAFISDGELAEACAFLASHEEIREILVSGGDPMTATDDQLRTLFTRLREARPGILIRLCTRAPVFAPERFTENTIAMLRSFRPLWVIPHINHPAEISEQWSSETRECLSSLADAGIPLQSQTVLLRGVNDSIPVLTQLFTDLVNLGIRPGYLFQLDLAKGTGHFRVPLGEGVKLYQALRKELSGLSLPVYAVDLPGGGGKVHILSTRFVRDGEQWKYVDSAGKAWYYPL